jgi:5-methylcytosine-specific restriction endonuclease McrA
MAQTNLEKLQSFIARLVDSAEDAEQIIKDLDGTDWQELCSYQQNRREQKQVNKEQRDKEREEEHAKTDANNRKAEEKRRARIAELQSMPYAEYLKTYEWRKKREYALKRADHCCNICNKPDESLDVHHRTYERRGNESYTDLIVLCRGCHATFHKTGRLFKHTKAPVKKFRPSS